MNFNCIKCVGKIQVNDINLYIVMKHLSNMVAKTVKLVVVHLLESKYDWI